MDNQTTYIYTVTCEYQERTYQYLIAAHAVDKAITIADNLLAKEIGPEYNKEDAIFVCPDSSVNIIDMQLASQPTIH